MSIDNLTYADVVRAIENYQMDGQARAETRWPGSVPFLERPFVLLGTRGWDDQPFFDHVLPKLNIIAVIDNRRASETGSRFFGMPILGDEALESLKKQYRDLTAINLGSHPYFLKLTRSINLPCVSATELFSLMDLPPGCSLLNDINKITVDNADILLNFSKRLSDEASRTSYFHYLMFRLYLDVHYLVEIERPWNDQFFNHSFLKFKSDEVIVDGGAFDGDTVRNYMRDSNGIYKKIYAFEPDAANFERLKNYAARERDVVAIEKGLSDQNGMIYFIEGNGHGSHIPEDENKANSKIEVCRLDDAVTERVTYIKLDIEGAEMDAIAGAQNIIAKDNPRLGIAVYHRPEHMVQMASFIDEHRKDDDVYFSHHTPYVYDSTVFTVPYEHKASK